MTPEHNLCNCEDWLPNYDGSPICYRCKFPLSKGRADTASLFWQGHSPSEFFKTRMYNVSKLEVCFKKWLAINEAGGGPSGVK